MKKRIMKTDRAPAAIGPYSQAVACGSTVYLSRQIALDPQTMKLVEGGVEAECHRVFCNLAAVAEAAGGSLVDVAKLNIYLADLGDYPKVNEIMGEYFVQPYPARAAIGIASLPRGARIEADAVMWLESAAR